MTANARSNAKLREPPVSGAICEKFVRGSKNYSKVFQAVFAKRRAFARSAKLMIWQ
jgi:hypothetical protein